VKSVINRWNTAVCPTDN